MYYSNQERLKEILEFVKHNPETTKSKVINHMKKLHMGTLMTTQPLLIQLIDSRKITVLKDKPNSRNHRLIFNDENEFNRLDGEFKRLKENISLVIGELDKCISPNSKIMTNIDVLANLINLAQPFIFVIISNIVTDIERNIKSKEDRQALYHRLPDILIVSNELNQMIFPVVVRRATRVMREYEEDVADVGMDSIVKNVYANLFFSVTNLFHDFMENKSN